MTVSQVHRQAGEYHRRDMHHAVGLVAGVWPRAVVDLEAIGFPRARSYDGAPTGGHGSMMVPDEHGNMERVPATGVEIVALNTHVAVAWVAELHDVTVRLLREARPRAGVWPMPPPELYMATVGLAVDRICDSWTADDLIDFDPASANYCRDVFGLYRLADSGVKFWPPPARKGDQAGTVTVGERGNSVELCKLCGEPVAGGRADPIRRIDGDAYHGKSCWFTVTRHRQPRAS